LLGIQLGGTHTYFNQRLVKPTIGDAIREVKIEDLKKTTQVMYASEFLMLVMACTLLTLFKLV
jgi:adenosylcobinamide-phosphate synthase